MNLNNVFQNKQSTQQLNKEKIPNKHKNTGLKLNFTISDLNFYF